MLFSLAACAPSAAPIPLPIHLNRQKKAGDPPYRTDPFPLPKNEAARAITIPEHIASAKRRLDALSGETRGNDGSLRIQTTFLARPHNRIRVSIIGFHDRPSSPGSPAGHDEEFGWGF